MSYSGEVEGRGAVDIKFHDECDITTERTTIFFYEKKKKLTPNMYSFPLTTTLAAPLLRGGITLPGGNDTRLHVRCCRG